MSILIRCVYTAHEECTDVLESIDMNEQGIAVAYDNDGNVTSLPDAGGLIMVSDKRGSELFGLMSMIHPFMRHTG